MYYSAFMQNNTSWILHDFLPAVNNLASNSETNKTVTPRVFAVKGLC